MADERMTDEQIENWANGSPDHKPAIVMAREIRQHRAALKRIEEAVLSLEHANHPDMRAVGNDLRKRLKGGV